MINRYSSINVPQDILDVCCVLRDHGFMAYVVGGAVRDSLLGIAPHDWDICTNALPQEVLSIFVHAIPTGEKHGTATVACDSMNVEVTTLRKDGTYSDGRRPDSVEFGATLFEDLSRRDFTMNAIAYDPFKSELIDPFCGYNDVMNKRIVAVGDPFDRFREDGLRILRAFRFSAQLGFKIDLRTLWATVLLREPLLNISIERVTSEITKLIVSDSPMIGLSSMMRSYVFQTFIPELTALNGVKQNRYHAYDVWEHTMRCVDAACGGEHVRWAALFHDIAKPTVMGMHPERHEPTFYNHENVGAEMSDGIMRRLKFSNEMRERVSHLIKHHLIRYERNWSNSTVRRWVRSVGIENVEDVCRLAYADHIAKGPIDPAYEYDCTLIDELHRRVHEMKVKQELVVKLAINGDDVMRELGIKQGTQVGEILKSLLDVVTENPEMNERNKLIEYVRKNGV